MEILVPIGIAAWTLLCLLAVAIVRMGGES
jgi:hypothetical protein